MSTAEDQGNANPRKPATEHKLNRRSILLGGTALAAGTALSAATPVQTAQAQTQPAPSPPSGQRPNIVFIMGDDIGWFNLGAYHQ
jgi:hypothetical protein